MVQRMVRATARPVLLAVGLLALMALPAPALDPPHDESNNIGCGDCHAMHGGGMMGFGLMPRGTEQEAMCKTCHNPTGQASSKSDVGNHVVDGGAVTVDCGSCHDAHRYNTTTDTHSGGQTTQNLKLVRGNPKKYVAAALDTAIFQQEPEHFAFTSAPYNGICQTCHTQTAHYRNDGTGTRHRRGGGGMHAPNCVSCHAHSDGFLP